MRSYLHNGALGDIIYSLPAVIAMGSGTYYTKEKFINIIGSLLEMQPYIDEVRNCTEKLPDGCVDFRGYRSFTRKEPLKHLVECHSEAIGVEVNYSDPWLFNIEPNNHIYSIVVGRSLRYHDKEDIDWGILKHYRHYACFVGFLEEYKAFINKIGFRIAYMHSTSGLTLASIIKRAELFIGNQSFAWSLAEAMKVPRVLEVYHKNPDTMPCGRDGYVYLDKSLIERYTNG